MTAETTTETNDAAAAAEETGADTALGAAASQADAETQTEETKADVTDADKADDAADKTDETVEGAPEAYDTSAWTMPEGVDFDTDGFAAVEPVLRDLNLSNDQAGKLMTTYAEKIVPMIAARTTEQIDQAGAQLKADLARDLQNDPEVGGKKLGESQSFAAKAIFHFIPDANERSEFSTFLNESGLGSHPLLMRVVSGAGRTLAEASTPAAATATAPLSESEKFYGKKG